MIRFPHISLGGAVSLALALPSSALTLTFKTETGSLGAALDGQASGTFMVLGSTSLEITVEAVSSNDATDDLLNATTESFGINDGLTGDDTDTFDAAFGEVATFSFNQAVEISMIDFVSFTSGESFSFAGVSITDSDISGSVYTASTPILIGKDTSFSLSATAGSIGIERIELTVVPEPSVALLGLLGGGLLLRRRR